jgi:hypothetical protein
MQLVNLYGLAVDSQQWHLFDSIFTTDVDADYGASSYWTNLEQFKSQRRRGPSAQLLQRRLAPDAKGGRRQPPLGRHRLV